MPATQNFVLAKGYPCSAAVVKKRAVKFTGDQTVGPIAAEGDRPCGVTLFDVTTAEIAKGKKASVMTEGRVIMEAGEAIAMGAVVAIDGTGKAVNANAGATNIGICDEPAGGAGNECSVHLWVGA